VSVQAPNEMLDMEMLFFGGSHDSARFKPLFSRKPPKVFNSTPFKRGSTSY